MAEYQGFTAKIADTKGTLTVLILTALNILEDYQFSK